MVDDVPYPVREYWAKVLTAPVKPKWAVSVLVEEGLISKEAVAMEGGSINDDLAYELAEDITAEQVLKAFETVGDF